MSDKNVERWFDSDSFVVVMLAGFEGICRSFYKIVLLDSRSHGNVVFLVLPILVSENAQIEHLQWLCQLNRFMRQTEQCGIGIA